MPWRTGRCPGAFWIHTGTRGADSAEIPTECVSSTHSCHVLLTCPSSNRTANRPPDTGVQSHITCLSA